MAWSFSWGFVHCTQCLVMNTGQESRCLRMMNSENIGSSYLNKWPLPSETVLWEGSGERAVWPSPLLGVALGRFLGKGKLEGEELQQDSVFFRLAETPLHQIQEIKMCWLQDLPVGSMQENQGGKWVAIWIGVGDKAGQWLYFYLITPWGVGNWGMLLGQEAGVHVA